MNLLKEKKTLKKLIYMLSWREELIRYLWASGLVGLMLALIVLGVLKHSDRPYLLLLSDILVVLLEERLAIANDAAAVFSGLIIFICSYMVSVFLSKFIYFNRRIRKKNEQIQNFCRGNQETLKMIFEEGWLNQKESEREEINARINVLLQKLEEEIDPIKAKEVRNKLKKLGRKINIKVI